MFLKTRFYSFIFKRLLLFTMILCMLNYSDISHAASKKAKEYQVKAVFLYNFANFIKWPQTAFTNQQTSFNICILGRDPFKQNIDKMIKNEQVDKRAVRVKRIKNIKSVDRCQILFICKSEAANFTTILNIIRKHPILTVSDIKNFVERGGMIQFFKHRKRIRFYISPDILKKSGLYASANLLRVAKIVH